GAGEAVDTHRLGLLARRREHPDDHAKAHRGSHRAARSLDEPRHDQHRLAGGQAAGQRRQREPDHPRQEAALRSAIGGPVRFCPLERLIQGISRRMLTLTLRNLERDGLLVRTVYPTVPPKVEYTATDMARELRDCLAALTDWAERHRADIATARAAYDSGREQT